MNIINLLSILKNQIDYTTFQRIKDDFMEDYREEYKKLRPCKSTMEKAIKKYIAGATFKDDQKTGTYSNGYTALMIAGDIESAESDRIQKVDLASKVLEMFKTRRPVDCYFMDSIALYKALKKQEQQDYLLHIDGHYYNAKYITEMIECIADSKERYISCEICENGALLIKQKNAALILPVVVREKRSQNDCACHPSKNVNMQDFLRYCDGIEKEKLKTA